MHYNNNEIIRRNQLNSVKLFGNTALQYVNKHRDKVSCLLQRIITTLIVSATLPISVAVRFFCS